MIVPSPDVDAKDDGVIVDPGIVSAVFVGDHDTDGDPFESARILHGSVQTRLMSCAVAIEQASQSLDVEAFRAAMREAHDALVPPVLGGDHSEALVDQLERTVSLWSGLCKVDVNLDGGPP